MVVRISDKTQNYSKVTKLLVKPKLFKCSLDITTKVGVYVHLSCLIERLILRQGIAESEGMEDFAKKYPDLIENIKNIFSGVEYRYSVEIPIPEIRYLLNYFNFDEKINEKRVRQ